MRRSLVGALFVAALVIAATAGRSSSEMAYGQREIEAISSPAAELITHVSSADGQAEALTVVDPRQRVIAVYHVDRSTGAIALKSVRNFTWDLQMIEFNSGEPLPQDIRAAGSSAIGRGGHQHRETGQQSP